MVAERVVTIEIPARRRCEATVLTDEAGIAFLEALRADVAAFASADYDARMRRDLVKLVRADDAGPDDF